METRNRQSQRTQNKSILALCRQAPYGNVLAREGLEAVLACAAMDQVPEILFLNDGVFQLLPQAAEAIREKSLYRNLQALPMFGVETVHLCRKSLEERGLDSAAMEISGAQIKLVDDVGPFIASFDHALNF